MREISLGAKERQGWGPKFEAGTDFATPFANLHVDFSGMSHTSQSYPDFDEVMVLLI
jgi:hypothetical protein